jgi:hypothetical protein
LVRFVVDDFSRGTLSMQQALRSDAQVPSHGDGEAGLVAEAGGDRSLNKAQSFGRNQLNSPLEAQT